MPRGCGVTEEKAEMVLQVALVVSGDLRKKARTHKRKLFQHGVVKETARLTGLHRSTVSDILRAYEDTGEIPDKSHKLRPRRPLKVTEQMCIMLREEFQSFVARGEVPTIHKLHSALIARAASTAGTDDHVEWRVSRGTTYKLMRKFGMVSDPKNNSKPVDRESSDKRHNTQAKHSIVKIQTTCD